MCICVVLDGVCQLCPPPAALQPHPPPGLWHRCLPANVCLHQCGAQRGGKLGWKWDSVCVCREEGGGGYKVSWEGSLQGISANHTKRLWQKIHVTSLCWQLCAKNTNYLVFLSKKNFCDLQPSQFSKPHMLLYAWCTRSPFLKGSV